MCICSAIFAPLQAWPPCAGINEQLIRRLLRFLPEGGQTVAIIDATDLPAPLPIKKRPWPVVPPNWPPRGSFAEGWPHSVYVGYKKHHAAFVVAPL